MPSRFGRRSPIGSRNFPWLIAEANHDIVGYAYASAHRSRPAYRWAVDVSIYIAASHQGQGLGRQLYGQLLPILRKQGFFTAHAGITLPNPGSQALHERFGFRHVGTFFNVGHDQGNWQHVGWWSLELQAPTTSTAPAEPKPFDPSWLVE